MNALLIHNDNLPESLIDSFSEQIKFDIPQDSMLTPNFSFDNFVHDQLCNELASGSFDVIFLPYNLSRQNYLEFTGVRLALHIRLTEAFRHTHVPIVFIGLETKEEIAKLTDYGSFLFTTGIFSTKKFKIEDLEAQFAWVTTEWKELRNGAATLTDAEYQKFLERIKIKPAANYASHHSVDNELALMRWSESIGCADQIPEVKNNISKGLYFKYHKQLHPESHNEREKILDLNSVSGNGRVLLIDDEEAKGWTTFYTFLLGANRKDAIELKAIGANFKELTQQSIVEAAIAKVHKFKPDVVLLDLRLCDADFAPKADLGDLTGLTILKKIKTKINRGIQVIITTASNKVWNFEAATIAGANGFIVKNPLDQLPFSISDKIISGIKKGTFLKKVSSDFNAVIKLSDFFTLDFQSELIIQLDVAFQLLNQSFEESKYCSFAFLQLFLLIEQFIKTQEIFLEESECLVKNSFGNVCVATVDRENERTYIKQAVKFSGGNLKIQKHEFSPGKWSRFDTNFMVGCILIFKYGNPTSGTHNWSKISGIRNSKVGHFDKKEIDSNPTHAEIEELIYFILYFFDNRNESAKNIAKGLKVPTFEEKTAKLMDKYS